MQVDYERAWMELKTHILEKNSHGKRELVERMAEIEVESRIPEGERGFDGTPLPLAPIARSRGSRAGVA